MQADTVRGCFSAPRRGVVVWTEVATLEEERGDPLGYAWKYRQENLLVDHMWEWGRRQEQGLNFLPWVTGWMMEDEVEDSWGCQEGKRIQEFSLAHVRFEKPIGYPGRHVE